MSPATNWQQQFDWDEENIAHIARHGVTPAEAEQILNSDTVEVDCRFVDGEERYAEVGKTATGRFLVVAWAFRHHKLRVMTSFPANKAAREMWMSRYTKGVR